MAPGAWGESMEDSSLGKGGGMGCPSTLLRMHPPSRGPGCVLRAATNGRGAYLWCRIVPRGAPGGLALWTPRVHEGSRLRLSGGGGVWYPPHPSALFCPEPAFISRAAVCGYHRMLCERVFPAQSGAVLGARCKGSRPFVRPSVTASLLPTWPYRGSRDDTLRWDLSA